MTSVALPPGGDRRNTQQTDSGAAVAPTHSATQLPPQNLDAEQAVLGAMMLNPQVIDVVTDAGLVASDFYRPSHRIIFETIVRLSQSQAVDELTVVEALQQDNKLDDIGGRRAVEALTEHVPAVANARHYATIVREQATLRDLIKTGTQIAQLGYEHAHEPRVLVDTAERLVYELSHQRQTGGFLDAGEMLPEIYDEIVARAERGDTITGVATGFRDFDTMTGGLQHSNLIIVGGRASMGKTAWALNVAENVILRAKHHVAFFSLEMAASELLIRMLCSVAKVDQSRVRVGKPHPDDYPRLIDAMGQLAEAAPRLHIDEASLLTPFELRSKARQLQTRLGGNLGLIVVDYLQLMDPGMRIDARHEAVAYISRQMKSLARDLKVPVMALSQLSRGVEQRNEKRPMLSDLRESGSLEQDADVVVFVHRPEYYDKENPDLKGKAEIIIAKHRNGPTGAVQVAFLDKYTKFVDLAKPHQAPPAPPVV